MNDAVLLERWVKRRDADAFNEIVTRFTDQVYGTCRNILRNDADAEEVAQECFLLLVRSGGSVRTSLGGWLHHAATTKSLDRIRGEARRREHERIHVESAPRHAEATWDDLQEHVDAAIDTLPEDLREAVVAHFIGRKSRQEIAWELRLTKRAVSYRIQRGVEALRADLVRRGVTVSSAGLGALILAQAAPAAPLSLKASLGKLALAAGLPAGTGAGAATAASAAGSLLLMKTKLVMVAAVVLVAAGVYLATWHDTPNPPAESIAERELDGSRVEPERAPVSESGATLAEAIPASASANETPDAAGATEEHRGVITGVVLLSTGQPAPGAGVRYLWKPSLGNVPVAGMEIHESAPVKTDAKGEFALNAVPRGLIYVTAESEEGRATELADVNSRWYTRDITLTLKGGERIAGTVVSKDGKGIPGARIVPLYFESEEPPNFDSEGIRVVTGPGGEFEIEHLKQGQWIFRATADGYGADLAGPWPLGTRNARIVLSPGVDLTCRIIRADSQAPLQGIRVTLRYDGERAPFLTATSNESGNAVFPSLGKGAYVLDVKDSQYSLDGTPVPVNIDPARKSAGATLELINGGQVRGRVTDSVSGGGVAGVVLRARSSTAGRYYTSTPTAEDGGYTISGMPAGDYRIQTGSLPLIYSRKLPDAPPSVTVTEGGVIDALDFVLTPGASVGGIVLDSGGLPVAGAQVLVKSENGGAVLGDLYTQEDGRFAVGDFAPGESIVLSAHSRIAESGLTGPFTAGDPGGAEIEVTLSRERTGMITGRVTDPQGRPFPCRLQARAEEPELQFPVMPLLGEADGLGNFVLAGACAGTYTITIVPERTARQDSEPVRVQAGQTVSGVNLVYDAGKLFEIAGIVTDVEENPVAGVRVTVNGQSASSITSETSDENGVFHFKDLPAGRYMLQAYAEGYDEMQSLGMAEAGDMNARVIIMPLATVSGRVSNAQGRPVTDFSISLYATQNPEYVRANRRYSDKDGVFSVNGTGNVELLMRVEAEGYVTAEVELGSLRAGREMADVEVVLEAAP